MRTRPAIAALALLALGALPAAAQPRAPPARQSAPQPPAQRKRPAAKGRKSQKGQWQKGIFPKNSKLASRAPGNTAFAAPSLAGGGSRKDIRARINPQARMMDGLSNALT